MTKKLLIAIASLLFFYTGNRTAYLIQTGDGDALERITGSINGLLPNIKENPFFIKMDLNGLAGGLILAAVFWLILIYNLFGKKKYMHGKEHGSAEWGTPKDSLPYKEKNMFKNILFTMTEMLSMSNRMKRTETDDFNRNKNVVVIGGSGSGKTRFYVKPNIMQMHSSYVITDPKGSLLHECGKMLADNGYRIKVFNLISPAESDQYNPFSYIVEEKDILKLIENLITNTDNKKATNADDFFPKAEKALMMAVFGYLFYEANKEDQSIGVALKMIRLAEVKEENEDYQSPLDIIFEDLKNENPNHFAVQNYEIYKMAAGKTAKSILVSIGVRLAPFTIDSIARIVAADTIELDMTGSERTALFILLPDTDRTFNFLAAMMYQQLFDVLVYKADHDYREQGSRLPYHVRCLCDEFANIGQIPQFEILISTLRSREISVSIICQNLAQLKNLYKDTWEIITGNCDALLFLGGMEQSTQEYITKMCGKATIDNRNINETKGEHGSFSMQYQVLGRDLITPDEVGGLKGRECILKIRGCKPFLSKKYDIEAHPNYRLLSDFNQENWYDIGQRAGQEAEAFFNDVSKIIRLPELNSLT